ncbi:MAG: hypothetical protein LR015_05490 [Verrucomicrobia bacterium]|nr:hypothetical protein [Verrucomicrobiota bacterium]
MHTQSQWNPFFTAPTQGKFSLEPWSPAKGRGKPVAELKEDFLGNPRMGSTPSIGAFE